jgi:NitT/TauT family transport system substrate-binding protein
MPLSIDRRRFVALAAAGSLYAGRSRAEGAALDKLTVGALPLTSSGPLFIAAEKGWFREAGLDVQIARFDTAGQVGVAVVAGDIELGLSGLTASFYNMAYKGALRMIAGQSREQPGFENVCFVASNKAWDDGVRTIPDLVGKRFGNTTIGSTIHYSLILACKKFNVDFAKITMVQFQTLPNLTAAFRGGNLEASALTQAIYHQLQGEKVGRLMAWVGDLTPWQLGALFASPKVIANRRDVVQRFVRTYVRACAAYNAAFNQPQVAGKVTKGPGYEDMLQILTKVVGQTPEQVAAGLAYIPANAALDTDDIRRQVAIWQGYGLADKGVVANELFDTSFLT